MENNFPKKTIFTPHRGELKNLTYNIKSEIDLNPVELLDELIDKLDGRYCLIKGQPNFLVNADGTINLMSHGNPSLATAGTGDVLSGICASAVSQGLTIDAASILSTFLHAECAHVYSSMISDFGMVASVQTYDRSGADEYIKNNHNDESIPLPFNSFVNVSGEERDLDFRFMTTVMDHKMTDPSCAITAYLAWHKLDANQLETVRPLKKTYLSKTFVDKIHEWSDIFKHPDWTDIEIKFLPQLDKDFKNGIKHQKLWRF